ncbi:MAG TPA: translation elongation factor Ts [Thermodesulfobacteriota bacterium]|nr:translation elongation factor Ts [Thermodesulfobacteriota bacterium]
MAISAEMIKGLRERTGAGIMDCKKALSESGGDMDRAVDFLREKGLAAAQKKAGRVASEGLVYSYIHPGGKVGVLVEVNCESDFVAKTEDFAGLVKDIAMHIAAMNPQHVRRSEIPPEVIEKEREIYAAQARESGKPEKVLDKIVEGKVEKFYKEVCLLEQPFVKDSDLTVEKLVIDAIARIGENISVRRFARFKVGEGIEKKTADFSEEVAALQT